MRETVGPDFDDRLIRLVRDNPAIYDVNHEHYRRYQIRVAIWERIAAEMRTPSKFLQTKWKNIRYNYLQELKSFETGVANANIRKRRFREDLSFLQNTAQTYKKVIPKISSYNSSDNDSNSYVCTDTLNTSTYEIIEIKNNDVTPSSYGVADYNVNVAMETSHSNEHEILPTVTNNDCYGNNQMLTDLSIQIKTEKPEETQHGVTVEHKWKSTPKHNTRKTSTNYSEEMHSTMVGPSSPLQSNTPSPPASLITPIVVMENGPEFISNGETKQSTETSNSIISNATKRKSMPAPFPVLTPINDPIEMYCLSLVDSLRNMSRSERERVKFEFAKILKDAQYKDQS